MSIASIVTRGFSNGSLVGAIAELVAMGYDISTAIPPTVPVSDGLVGTQSTGNGISGNQTTGNGIVSTQTAGTSLTGRGRL
jgi:hypothetical protein